MRPHGADRELGDEIAFHVELETEKNVRLGIAPDDARRLALAHFGGVQRVRQEHRDVRRLRWIEDLASDIRFAFRMLRRTPILAAAAIITIALGIGANAAMFSAVNAVVLQPLPFPHPDRLFKVTEESAERGWHRQYASAPNMFDWRDAIPAFQDVAGYEYGGGSVTLTGFGDARRLHTADVTGNFFSTLGVRAEFGRTFEDAETWDARPRVALLSHRAWVREFGADPSIVGRSITLDNDSYQVVGIMPATFDFPFENLDVWCAMHWSPSIRQNEMWRRTRWIEVIARLAPGATPAAANAQLQRVSAQLARDFPAVNANTSAGLTPLHDFIVGETRLPLLVLLASVAILLLIACANVGNLLLIQATGRQREVALRLALGAGRGRVVRQAVTESLVLSLIGGACGLALGWAGTRGLVALQPKGLLPVHTFGVDRAVMLYVAIITTAAGLLFGVAPALWTRDRDPAEALKGGSRGGTEGRTVKRWGNALVIGEVALALLMTTGAGLLLRSFWQITRVDPGYDSHGVLAVNANAYAVASDPSAFYDQLMARARAIPGVTQVAAGSVPLGMQNAARSDFIARGRAPNGYETELLHFYVSPNYFETMRVPLRRGRLFTDDDRKGAPLVIVINETLAKDYFAREDPIGQAVCFDKVAGPKCKWYTVIGVVADVHDATLENAPRITVFESTRQSGIRGSYLLRTAGDPASLAAPVRAIARDLEPRVWVSARTADETRQQSLARPRFFAALLLLFSTVGLVLSVVGVYALLAQLARNRTREMGIRVALGAQSSQVRWLVVRHGLRLTAVGLTAGGVIALFATRVMTTLLFGVAPNDPPTFVGVALLLAGTSLLASWIPAVRASRANPVDALRAD